MKMFASVVLLALVSNGAWSGEVGAYDQSLSEAPSSFDVAVAEIGASNRWDSRQGEFRVVPATTADTKQLNKLDQHLDAINAKMNAELTALIEQKVAQSLRF